MAKVNLKKLRELVADLAESGLSEKEISDSVEQAKNLDRVDPTIAKLLSQSGLQDGELGDDPISVTKGSWSAVSLKPSQTSMVLEKAVGMALGMLASGKIGGDLGAMVSADGHILDGHHRWAATILASGKKGKVGGHLAKIPGKDLLKVLNILSKGAFGVRNGNPGKGSISRFTDKNVRDLLTEYVEKGVGGSFPIPAEKVRNILERSFGSVEDGIAQMAQNVRMMQKSTPSWAPDRKQMPVIDPKNVPKAVKVLEKGQVNWKPPFLPKEGGLLVRLAASLPTGSVERRALLGVLGNGKSATEDRTCGRDSTFRHGTSKDLWVEWEQMEHYNLKDGFKSSKERAGPFRDSEANAFIKRLKSKQKGMARDIKKVKGGKRATLNRAVKEASVSGRDFARKLDRLVSDNLVYAELYEVEKPVEEFIMKLEDIEDRARERVEREGR